MRNPLPMQKTGEHFTNGDIYFEWSRTGRSFSVSPQSISSWSMDVVVIYVSINSGKNRTDKRND